MGIEPGTPKGVKPRATAALISKTLQHFVCIEKEKDMLVSA